MTRSVGNRIGIKWFFVLPLYQYLMPLESKTFINLKNCKFGAWWPDAWYENPKDRFELSLCQIIWKSGLANRQSLKYCELNTDLGLTFILITTFVFLKIITMIFLLFVHHYCGYFSCGDRKTNYIQKKREKEL